MNQLINNPMLSPAYKVFDLFSAGVLGYNVIEIINMIDMPQMSDSLQLLSTLIAIIYFVFFRLPSELKMNKLKRQDQKLRNEKLEKEIYDTKCDCPDKKIV